MALREWAPLAGTLGTLIAQLRSIEAAQLNDEAASRLESTLAWLEGLVLDLGAQVPALSEKLWRSAAALGHSLEYELAHMVQSETDEAIGHAGKGGWLELARLQNDLAQEDNQAAGAISTLLDILRVQHLHNAAPWAPAELEQWLELEIMREELAAS